MHEPLSLWSCLCITNFYFECPQNGAILNRIFQPHEAHVPFILQFFIDFNLYGMSYVDFHHVKFRKTDHTGNFISLSAKNFFVCLLIAKCSNFAFPDLVSEIPAELMLPESISAVSLSQFEVDVSASCILNRPSSQGLCSLILCIFSIWMFLEKCLKYQLFLSDATLASCCILNFCLGAYFTL